MGLEVISKRAGFHDLKPEKMIKIVQVVGEHPLPPSFPPTLSPILHLVLIYTGVGELIAGSSCLGLNGRDDEFGKSTFPLPIRPSTPPFAQAFFFNLKLWIKSRVWLRRGMGMTGLWWNYCRMSCRGWWSKMVQNVPNWSTLVSLLFKCAINKQFSGKLFIIRDDCRGHNLICG